MDAMSWWRAVGTEQARQAVIAAGTSWEYFQHIAYYRKRPGPDLAWRLIEASGGQLSLDKLLFPNSHFAKPKRGKSTGQVVQADV